MKLYRSTGRQRVGQVDEVRLDEIRALIDDDFFVDRRRALQDRNRIRVAVVELIGVVVADRDHRHGGVVDLQRLQQLRRGLGLRRALGADRMPSPPTSSMSMKERR